MTDSDLIGEVSAVVMRASGDNELDLHSPGTCADCDDKRRRARAFAKEILALFPVPSIMLHSIEKMNEVFDDIESRNNTPDDPAKLIDLVNEGDLSDLWENARRLKKAASIFDATDNDPLTPPPNQIKTTDN